MAQLTEQLCGLVEVKGLLQQRVVQIAALMTAVTELIATNSELVASNAELPQRLAQVEHLLSCNSGNSSNPLPGMTILARRPPAVKPERTGGVMRKRGKQPGAPGANLA
ncbi:DUF6444 domain-containing protein [Nocardia araoensis]|uniref:DUF6444 domain-containing protein n=1 Tax=Nocardia araoensis TaxID=228600 RepID=UPI0002F9E96B|nr:DUF6444 domain-containing protein [Nocardia araoensis]